MLLPLPRHEVDLIEVVRITDPARHLTSPDLAGEDVAIWEGTQVQHALTLITDLPAGARMRCFLPVWGIRAHGATHLLYEVAFCFRCNDARLWGPDLDADQQGQTFDGESAVARELLDLFRACLPV